GMSYGGGGDSPPPPPPPGKTGDSKLEAVAKKMAISKNDLVIESHGTNPTHARARAQAARSKLIDDGVPAKRIHLVSKVGQNEASNLRLLSVAPGATPETTAPPPARVALGDDPVGESHFIADRAMDVRNGSSAMVAMVHKETQGGVVYLYDPISDRGDK